MNKLDHDFTNAKVGDEVHSVRFGKGVINEIFPGEAYPISVMFSDFSEQGYTIDGKWYKENKEPDLYNHPIKVVHADAVVIEEREMMVSDNEKDWYQRVVFMEKRDKYFFWSNFETIEEVNSQINLYVTRWKYAITKEEYEERFGEKEEARKRIQELQEEIEQIKKENGL